ncbi:hypothetical protein RN001_007940 [Aquatica leii]|uniref:Uncharacterized protein n=1 Tax=Aquatica leii TaxID=1421715 RepID=A0AAN7SH19_9COLE|nr:hypothetical protein RN001_007940 [Aquatica leii]
MLSWDIIFWKDEDAVDYVPSVWASSTGTEYKFPVGPKMTEMKKRQLVLECRDLEDGEYFYYSATCKKKGIQSLERAKMFAQQATYTSTIETETSSDSELEQPIRKKFKKRSYVPMPTHEEQNEIFSDNENEVVWVRPIISSLRASTPEQMPSLTQTNTTNEHASTSECHYTMLQPASTFSVTPNFMDTVLNHYGEFVFHVKNLEKRLNSIEVLLQAQEQSTTSRENVVERNEVLNLLPLTSVAEITLFEEELKNVAKKKALVQVLYLVGGETPHKSIYLQMAKLLSPEVATHYSSLGKKKNYHFALWRCLTLLLKPPEDDIIM